MYVRGEDGFKQHSRHYSWLLLFASKKNQQLYILRIKTGHNANLNVGELKLSDSYMKTKRQTSTDSKLEGKIGKIPNQLRHYDRNE